MKKIVSKKLIAVSLAVALISGASIVTANAALDISASDVSAAAAPAESACPVAPASDFTGTGGSAPSVVISPTRVIPEPGTMYAGFAVLAYLVLRTGRRARA